MNARSVRCRDDSGWTFIEATISIVIMAIMVLGLTVVLLAFREQLDKSWAVRVMDQYGNDVIESLTHELRNATDVEVRPGGFVDRIDVTYLDPIRHNIFLTSRWRADMRNVRITHGNNDLIDPTFPPQQLGRGESYSIVRFQMSKYGTSNAVGDLEGSTFAESQDRPRRKQTFQDATYDIRLTLRYERAPNPLKGEKYRWFVEKEYFNRVYLRNKNLIVKKGITD